MVRILLQLGFILFAVASTVQAQEFTFGDGIPDRIPGEFVSTNVTYLDANGQLVSEPFNAPKLRPDFGVVPFINFSTQDPTRNFDNIPNFGLAKFHWWFLGGDVLQRAQRQYAECVGKIKILQKLMKEPILYDDPRNPMFPWIIGIREYVIPFEPIQYANGDTTKAPRLLDAIAHAKASLISVNLTVYFRFICEGDLKKVEKKFKKKFKIK